MKCAKGPDTIQLNRTEWQVPDLCTNCGRTLFEGFVDEAKYETPTSCHECACPTLDDIENWRTNG